MRTASQLYAASRSSNHLVYLINNASATVMQDPGMFEVRIMTPPPKSLGIHSLPPGTTSGEVIEVEG